MAKIADNIDMRFALLLLIFLQNDISFATDAKHSELADANEGSTANISDHSVMCKSGSSVVLDGVKVQQCEEEKVAAGCEKVEEFAVDKSSMRDCAKQVTCAEYESNQEFFRACAENWKGAWKDIFGGMFSGPSEAEMVYFNKSEFLANCLDQNCKRAALGFYQKYFTSEELGLGTLTPQEKKEILNSNFQDSAVIAKYKSKLGVPLEELVKKLFVQLRKQYPDGKPLPVPFKVPWSPRVVTKIEGDGAKDISELMSRLGNSYKASANEFLDRLGIKNRACYDPIKVREMQCYAFFSIIEPTIIAGATLKIAKIGKIGTINKLSSTRKLGSLSRKFRFSHIAGASAKIMEKYPPDKFYFIGIGRSPYPMVDYINLVKPNSARTIPISYNEYTRRKPIIGMASWKRSLEPYTKGDAATREAYNKFMKQFLPTKEELGGRQIVVMDFADYGSSTIKFSKDLDTTLHANGLTNQQNLLFLSARQHEDQWYIHKMALEHLGKAETDKITGGLGWWELDKKPKIKAKLRERLPAFTEIQLSGDLGDLGRALDEELYKPYSPYGHHTPTPSSRDFKKPLEPRASHEKFVDALTNEFNDNYRDSPAFRNQINSLRNPE